MSWLGRSFAGAQYHRAERNLRSTEIALTAFGEGTAGSPEAIMRQLVAEARATLTSGDIEGCWHMLNAARRIKASLGSAADRIDARQVLWVEMEKMSVCGGGVGSRDEHH